MGRWALILTLVLLLTACGGGGPEEVGTPLTGEETPAVEVTPTGYVNEELGFTWKAYSDWTVEEGEGEVIFTSPDSIYSLTMTVSAYGEEELRDLVDTYLADLQETFLDAVIAVPAFSQRLGGEEALRTRFNYQSEAGNQAHDLILVSHGDVLYTVVLLSPWDDFQRDIIIGQFLTTFHFL